MTMMKSEREDTMRGSIDPEGGMEVKPKDIEVSFLRLEKEVAQFRAQTDELLEKLSPVLNQSYPADEKVPTEDDVSSTPLAAHLDSISGRVSRGNAALNEILTRLELGDG